MGFMVSGRCTCGYAANNLAVGVGMQDKPGTWLSPCLCRTCLQTVSVNVLAKTPACPTCRSKDIYSYVSYVDPDCGTEEGEQYPSCAASEPLFDKRFECPACGKNSLRFEFSGMWDEP